MKGKVFFTIFTKICSIIGIVNVLGGKCRELPLIGKYKILN
ncbi:hypothetical protein [Fusobacterium sp. PH5-44]